MVCCLFDDSPLPDDPRGYRQNQFQISMMDSICSGQPVCCFTYCFPCCMNYYIRHKVLNGNYNKYTCCQGYADSRCFKSGSCCEKDCPQLCLCCESVLCLGLSMSTSRIFIMDQYDLQPDPMDNQIIRFSNCLQLFACILDIIAIFVPACDESANICQTLADCVFYSTIGCMAGQVYNEINYQKSKVMFAEEISPIINDNNNKPYQQK